MATTTILDGHVYITTGTVSGRRTASISSIDGDTTTIVITTSSAHNLIIGDSITISGTTNYNGKFVINVVGSTTTLTINTQGFNFASESSGTITGPDFITHNSGELVDIWATKIDQNYDNAIRLINPFISKNDTGEEKPGKVIALS